MQVYSPGLAPRATTCRRFAAQIEAQEASIVCRRFTDLRRSAEGAKGLSVGREPHFQGPSDRRALKGRQKGEVNMAGTFSCLTFHLVFSTTNRLPLITRDVREMIYPYIGGIVREMGGITLGVGGMPDHLHLVARLPTKLAVADATRTIKANSSKWMNEQRRLSKFGWQKGYGAFSVSQSMVPTVVEYVGNQEHHHRAASFSEELSMLLRRHDVEFDPKYLP